MDNFSEKLLTRIIEDSPLSAKNNRVFGLKIIASIHSIQIAKHKPKDFKAVYKDTIEYALEGSRFSSPILDAVKECMENLEKISDPLAQNTARIMRIYFHNLACSQSLAFKFDLSELDKSIDDLFRELGI